MFYEATVKLLGDGGRTQFIQPLYKLLDIADRPLALRTFEENRNFYHPICRDVIEKDLYRRSPGGHD